MLRSIFIRLNKAKNLKGKLLNGKEIMQSYKSVCEQKGAVWYSTDVKKMADSNVELYKEAINNHITVKIFFVISKNGGGANEINYEAEVLDIVTASFGLSSPDKDLTPDDWKDYRNKLWIKITNLKESNETAKDFFIGENEKRKPLSAILSSRCSFGYIFKK